MRINLQEPGSTCHPLCFIFSRVTQSQIEEPSMTSALRRRPLDNG